MGLLGKIRSWVGSKFKKPTGTQKLSAGTVTYSLSKGTASVSGSSTSTSTSISTSRGGGGTSSRTSITPTATIGSPAQTISPSTSMAQQQLSSQQLAAVQQQRQQGFSVRSPPTLSQEQFARQGIVMKGSEIKRTGKERDQSFIVQPTGTLSSRTTKRIKTLVTKKGTITGTVSEITGDVGGVVGEAAAKYGSKFSAFSFLPGFKEAQISGGKIVGTVGGGAAPFAVPGFALGFGIESLTTRGVAERKEEVKLLKEEGIFGFQLSEPTARAVVDLPRVLALTGGSAALVKHLKTPVITRLPKAQPITRFIEISKPAKGGTIKSEFGIIRGTPARLGRVRTLAEIDLGKPGKIITLQKPRIDVVGTLKPVVLKEGKIVGTADLFIQRKGAKISTFAELRGAQKPIEAFKIFSSSKQEKSLFKSIVELKTGRPSPKRLGTIAELLKGEKLTKGTFGLSKKFKVSTSLETGQSKIVTLKDQKFIISEPLRKLKIKQIEFPRGESAGQILVRSKALTKGGKIIQSDVAVRTLTQRTPDTMEGLSFLIKQARKGTGIKSLTPAKIIKTPFSKTFGQILEPTRESLIRDVPLFKLNKLVTTTKPSVAVSASLKALPKVPTIPITSIKPMTTIGTTTGITVGLARPFMVGGQGLKELQRVGQPQQMSIGEMLKINQLDIIKTDIKIDTKTDVRIGSKSATRIAEVTKTVVVPILDIPVPQSPILPPFSPPPFKPKILPPQERPPKIPIPFKFPKAKEVTPRIGRFPFFVRRFGEFKLGGYGRTPQQAFKLGKTRVERTLAASFKVPSFKGAKPFGFRTKKEKDEIVFVEKKKRRLKRGSGEIPEILKFKKLKGRKR